MSTRANPVVHFRRRLCAAGRARHGGFTLIEVLLTVAIVAAIIVPVLAWLLVTMERGNDQGQPTDTAGFAHISRFLTRDIATADAVDAPGDPGDTIVTPECVVQADLEGDTYTWLQTAKLEDDGSITEANYVTTPGEDEDDESSSLVRVLCNRDSAGVLSLKSTDVLADGLRDQAVAGPASTAPILIECAPRNAADPEPCGKITMTVQGAKAGSVSLEAARRVDPEEDGTAAVRAVIQCDPAGCQGFRQQNDSFYLTLDGSLSTAPLGIMKFEWDFVPVNGFVPHPAIVPGDPHPLDGSTIGARGLEKTPVLTLRCGPETTPDAWLDDVRDGNPGCIYRVRLKVSEDNGSTRTATATADIIIENSEPRVLVTPNPVEAYRAIPVVFSTAGTIDPDGAPDGDDLEYRWDFGDGTTSNDRTPTYVEDGETLPGHKFRCPPGTTAPADPEDVWCTLTATLRVSDEYSTVTETIPVNVRNAPPNVIVRGDTTITAPDKETTWSATYNPASPKDSDVWDPDGNDDRDGPGPVDPATFRWSLVSETAPNFEPLVQLGGETFTVCGEPKLPNCLPFGSYTLTLQVTDRDGLMVTTQSTIKVNTLPIAKARSKKGDGAWSTTAKVYSPKVGPEDPPDAPVTLDGSLSYDPDKFDRPGLPADPNAEVKTYIWRVWGGADWTAPAVWTACEPNLASAIANKRACQIVASGPEYVLEAESWPPRTYRIALAVVDNNNSESPCAEANPWTNSCVQSTDPADGPWWQQVRINGRPNITGITYSAPEGTLEYCAAKPTLSRWDLCRTTPYTFEPKDGITDDRDRPEDLVFQWSVPRLGENAPPTVVPGQTAFATYPASGSITTTLRNGVLMLSVTDLDGATRVFTQDLRLVNHPPITQISVEQSSQNLGTWTSDTPGSDPYRPTLISNTQGDPDGTIVSREWTIRRYDVTDRNLSETVLETITVTWNGGSCSISSSTPSMQLSPGSGHVGCNRIDGILDDWGRYKVSVTERDNDGGESSDTKTLLVLKPPVARITVTPEVSNCKLPNSEPPAANPAAGELPKETVSYSPYGSIPSYRITPNNRNNYTPCLFALNGDPAKSSHDGIGGVPTGYKWTFHHDDTVDFDPALMFNRFDRCSGWTVGQPLVGCFQFPITLEVQNEAGYPAETTFLLRFNAAPVSKIGVLPSSRGASRNDAWIRFPYCPEGCTITLTGRDDNDLKLLSFDPDGPPDRKTIVPIANGKYLWTPNVNNPNGGGPGATVDSPTNDQRDLKLTFLPRQRNQENAGSVSLRVTDDEDFQTNSSKNLRMNIPPQVGVPASVNSAANRNNGCIVADSPANTCTFKVGPGNPYIPDGIAAPLQAVVPEASPFRDYSCGLPEEADTNTDFGWRPIPGINPSERPATQHYEWTIEQGGNVTKLYGVSDVTCKVNAFLHSSGVNATIASSPPVTISSANGATAKVSLRVTDSDGDARYLEQELPVRAPDPEPKIRPVAPTPAPTECQLAKTNPQTGMGPLTPDCSLWHVDGQGRTFTLSSDQSSTPDGTPITARSWKLYNSAFGTTDVTASSGCVTTGGGLEFSCNLPASAGIWRAELTVTAGGRTARAVYYLKQNAAPEGTLVSVPTIERGKQFTIACQFADPDSRIVERHIQIVRGAEVLFSATNACTDGVVTGTIPISVAAGNATVRLWGIDFEGAVGPVATQTATITNYNPAAAFTMKVGNQTCFADPPPDPEPECVARPGQQITLNGSPTTDPDAPNSNLTFDWTVYGPDQNRVFSGQNPPAFSLTMPGQYTVALLVTDPDGAQASASKIFRVNGPPTVEIYVDGGLVPDSHVVPRTLPTTFDLSSDVDDPDGPFTYLWEVTDPNGLEVVSGQAATLDDVPLNTHGTFTVTLTVTDALGAKTTISRTVKANEAPTASIAVLRNGVGCTATGVVGCVANAPFSGPGATTVIAQGAGTDPDGTVALYRWEIQRPGVPGFELLQPVSPDAEVDLAEELETHGEGQYQIRLTTYDNVGSPSQPAVAVVTHNPKPRVEFDDDDVDAPRGQILNVVVDAVDPAPGTGPLDFSWTLVQGGTTLVGPEPSSFPAFTAVVPTTAGVGPATLEVTVTDIYGATTTATKTINIVNAAPIVQIDADPPGGLVTAPSATYTLTAVEDDLDGTVIGRNWEVTGPSGTEVLSETGPVLTHTFTGYGSYTVTLTSTDDLGATGTATFDVRLNQPPTAVIAPVSGPVLLGVPVAIDGSGSTDDTPIPEDGYLWQIESGPDVDGVEIDLTDPSTPLFTFNTVGTYTISLRVFDDVGVGSAVTTTTVEVVP